MPAAASAITARVFVMSAWQIEPVLPPVSFEIWATACATAEPFGAQASPGGHAIPKAVAPMSGAGGIALSRLTKRFGSTAAATARQKSISKPEYSPASSTTPKPGRTSLTPQRTAPRSSTASRTAPQSSACKSSLRGVASGARTGVRDPGLCGVARGVACVGGDRRGGAGFPFLANGTVLDGLAAVDSLLAEDLGENGAEIISALSRAVHAGGRETIDVVELSAHGSPATRVPR